MKKTLGWLAVAAVLTAGGLGCSTHHSILRAQESLDQARTAGAEQTAPYEFHSADAYLGYAMMEKEESDWSAAARFAEKSMEYSEQALQKVKGGTQ